MYNYFIFITERTMGQYFTRMYNKIYTSVDEEERDSGEDWNCVDYH